ncbi:hypothetical protein KSS87_023706 [Heliosperma pusillum]|nr:hypothetical protein KSS87_023706 [Heliosperma pusillum]
MAKSCKGLAEELVKCLSDSDCIKIQKRPIRECAGEKTPCIPTECVGLRETYFNCKRGQGLSRPKLYNFWSISKSQDWLIPCETLYSSTIRAVDSCRTQCWSGEAFAKTYKAVVELNAMEEA